MPTGSKQLTLAALGKENLKLQVRIARLEAELITSRNRIKALEAVKPEAVIETMTDEQLEARIAKLLNEAGMQVKPA